MVWERPYFNNRICFSPIRGEVGGPPEVNKNIEQMFIDNNDIEYNKTGDLSSTRFFYNITISVWCVYIYIHMYTTSNLLHALIKNPQQILFPLCKCCGTYLIMFTLLSESRHSSLLIWLLQKQGPTSSWHLLGWTVPGLSVHT